MIKKEGNYWVLYTKDGSRILGKHKTEKEAKEHERAIIAAKNKKRK